MVFTQNLNTFKQSVNDDLSAKIVLEYIIANNMMSYNSDDNTIWPTLTHYNIEDVT